MIYRAYLFTRSSKSDALEIVTDEEALSVPDSELPFYTILLPAYNEASVIIKLIENLAQMDYPAESPRGAPPDRGGRRGDVGRVARR